MRRLLGLCLVTAAAFVLFGSTGQGWAAMGKVSSFTFRGLEEDLTSPGGVFETDGIGDGRFSVVISGIGAVTGLTLYNSETKAEWFASSGAGSRGMRVRDNGGNDLVEAGGGLPLIPLLGSLALDLAIPGLEDPYPIPSGEYEIAVRFIDGSESRAKATVRYEPKETPPETTLIEARLLSPSEAKGNYVGPSEKAGAAGSADRAIALSLSGSDQILSIQVLSVRGRFAAWDTTPGNGRWLIGVEDDGHLLNKADGSIDLAFRDGLSLRLWLEDNGAFAGEETTFKVIVELKSGKKLESPITLSSGQQAGGGIVKTFAFQGRSGQDLVGRGERPGADGTKDWRFRIDIAARGTIISAILSLKGSPHRWDTLPGNDAPLLAVTDGEGHLLNRQDGSIRIPLYGETTFFLLAAAPSGVFSDQATLATSLQLVFDDGRIVEASLSDAKDVTPPPSASVTARLLPGTGRDITFSSEVLMGDGRPDRAVTVAFRNLPAGARLIEVAIEPRRSGRGWDTVPGNGWWAIAVTGDDGAILNGTDGSLSLPLDREATLTLWLTDEGVLSAGSRDFVLRAVFADGQVLETEIRR